MVKAKSALAEAVPNESSKSSKSKEELRKRGKIMKRLIKSKVYKQIYEKEHKSLLEKGWWQPGTIERMEFLNTIAKERKGDKVQSPGIHSERSGTSERKSSLKSHKSHTENSD